VGGIVVVDGNI